MDQIRLNIGCGPKNYKEYTNIDVRDNEKADVICDVRNLKSLYADNSVDEIFAKDVLEHLGILETSINGKMTWEWVKALQDWVDILKPGGVLKIQTPDAILLFQSYIGSPQERVHFEDWLTKSLFGTQNYPENTHRVALTEKHLLARLEEMGMKIAEHWIEQTTDMRITAVKGDSEPLVSLAHPARLRFLQPLLRFHG